MPGKTHYIAKILCCLTYYAQIMRPRLLWALGSLHPLVDQ